MNKLILVVVPPPDAAPPGPDADTGLLGAAPPLFLFSGVALRRRF